MGPGCATEAASIAAAAAFPGLAVRRRAPQRDPGRLRLAEVGQQRIGLVVHQSSLSGTSGETISGRRLPERQAQPCPTPHRDERLVLGEAGLWGPLRGEGIRPVVIDDAVLQISPWRCRGGRAPPGSLACASDPYRWCARRSCRQRQREAGGETAGEEPPRVEGLRVPTAGRRAALRQAVDLVEEQELRSTSAQQMDRWLPPIERPSPSPVTTLTSGRIGGFPVAWPVPAVDGESHRSPCSREARTADAGDEDRLCRVRLSSASPLARQDRIVAAAGHQPPGRWRSPGRAPLRLELLLPT